MVHLVPGWPRLVLLLLAVLLGAAALTAVLTLAPPASTPAGAPAAAALPARPPPAGLLVHVSGAVLKPGLYRLQRGDRVYAAIAVAGGLAPRADSARLPDLAGRLRDGEQVKVPFRKGAGGGVTAAKVPINSATAEELAAVPGFTPELAQAVVDYRDRFGPLASLAELTSVLGMSGTNKITYVRPELAGLQPRRTYPPASWSFVQPSSSGTRGRSRRRVAPPAVSPWRVTVC